MIRCHDITGQRYGHHVVWKNNFKSLGTIPWSQTSCITLNPTVDASETLLKTWNVFKKHVHTVVDGLVNLPPAYKLIKPCSFFLGGGTWPGEVG